MSNSYLLDKHNLEIIKKMLLVEHENIAYQLGLINRAPAELKDEELSEVVGLIDELSREEVEESQKLTTLLCALLWKYKKDRWTGLREFFLVVLSRIGLSPTANMVDDEYDPESRKHNRLNSLISEMAVAINKLKYEVTIGRESFSLTKFQKGLWDKIDSHEVIGVSAPTSAGKSFTILLKSIEILMSQGGTLVYIVPNLSLVSQVSSDYRGMLNKFGLSDYKIMNTYYEGADNSKTIYVLTQERAIGAFAHKDNPFANLRLLVVDEIQNIERASSEDEERSKVLYDSLIEFRINSKPNKIIISGPRINKIQNVAEEIFGEEAEEEETTQSPVVNITYSINKKGEVYYLKQYSDALDEPSAIVITNIENINGLGQKVYKQPFHDYLKFILKGLGEDSINIIFSPTTAQSRKTALSLISEYPESNRKEIINLINYIERTVHPNYDVVKTLRRGVVYHHGRLPHHVRRVIEKAVSYKLINNIVCTTTLMQGVNLPVQNVIIRNPNLFIRKKQDLSPKLSNYEFANLRGRAGRLLKDFIGRTFILDEGSFIDEDEQLTFFDDTVKDLEIGYSERFNQNKKAIINCLENNISPSSEMNYSYLLPYIRNCVLKYGPKSKKNLEAVGINLSEVTLNSVSRNLARLEVPIEVCLSNRYWDPLVLEKLYKQRHAFNLPITTRDQNVVNKLFSAISLMEKSYKYYFVKYLNIDNSDLIHSFCINADKWLKETTLSEILDTPYHNNPDNIEKTIGTLQNTVSFKLPALLKPIYDILYPENNFLSFIEMGAYRSKTRRLIEMGVPRETAIYLSTYVLQNLNDNDEDLENKINIKLKANYMKLDFWVKAQLETIIPM
ncbi:DEAD/DEAH box helicase [Paenibacillus illinoisensis]|uniref:DEAD/DEAH box helicase n=1 Tax=Paenibacillus illinoisensis TaxID=59845 RepID=UPI0030192BA2